MAAISEFTRAKIIGYLEAIIESAIEDAEYRPEPEAESSKLYLGQKASQPQFKPFHTAIIPNELRAFSEFERSLKISLTSAVEQCAYYIALDHHTEVQQDHDIIELVSDSALREVERQVLHFHQAQDEGEEPPSLDEMIDDVLHMRDEGEKSLKIAQSDLYIKVHDGTEYFFDITPPFPNRDACFRLTYRILYNHLIHGLPRPQVHSYAAFAYNPYGGARSDYRWSVAKMYLPFEQATLIGDEFWRVIGGETTYLELLEIYAEVGQSKSQDMIASFTQEE